MYRVHKARTIASTLRSVKDFEHAIVQAHVSKLIRNFQVQALALPRLVVCIFCPDELLAVRA